MKGLTVFEARHAETTKTYEVSSESMATVAILADPKAVYSAWATAKDEGGVALLKLQAKGGDEERGALEDPTRGEEPENKNSRVVLGDPKSPSCEMLTAANVRHPGELQTVSLTASAEDWARNDGRPNRAETPAIVLRGPFPEPTVVLTADATTIYTEESVLLTATCWWLQSVVVQDQRDGRSLGSLRLTGVEEYHATSFKDCPVSDTRDVAEAENPSGKTRSAALTVYVRPRGEPQEPGGSEPPSCPKSGTAHLALIQQQSSAWYVYSTPAGNPGDVCPGRPKAVITKIRLGSSRRFNLQLFHEGRVDSQSW